MSCRLAALQSVAERFGMALVAAGFLAAAVGFLAAAAGFLATAAAAQETTRNLEIPSGAGSVGGRVVHAESGEPIPGVAVVLYALSPTGAPGMRRTVSDEEGRYRFDSIATEMGHTYLVGARYQGVPHPGGRAVFAPGSVEAQVDVPVSDVTGDPAQVRVAELELRIDWPGSRIQVSEALALENEGARTYYVPAEGRAGAEPALRALLPDGAEAFRMPLGVIPEGVERDGSAITHWGPVHPGTGELAWSFTLPANQEEGSETVELLVPVPPHLERVTVLVPEAGPELLSAGTLQEGKEARLDGRSYRTYLVETPGDAVTLALRLPATRVDPTAFQGVETRIFLRADDAALDVSESHTFRVDGESRVTAGNENGLAWIPLQGEIGELRFGSSDPGLALSPDSRGGIRVSGTAPPGESTIELAYRLPVVGTGEFVRSFGQRLPLLSVFLGDTGRMVVESDRLHRRRPVRTADTTYMHLEAFEVEPGEEVRLRIGTREAGATPGGRSALALVGVLSLVAIALLVGPLLQTPSVSAPGEADGEQSIESRERQSLYAAIEDLDHDFETGKLSVDDHRTLREELRARAVALLRAERAGEESNSGAPPAATQAACSACGAEQRAGDRFCPQCGASLDERTGLVRGVEA